MIARSRASHVRRQGASSLARSAQALGSNVVPPSPLSSKDSSVQFPTLSIDLELFTDSSWNAAFTTACREAPLRLAEDPVP